MSPYQRLRSIQLVRSSALAVGNNTAPAVSVPWESVAYNSGEESWWSSAAPSNIVMPYTGLYLINMQATWANSSTVTRRECQLNRGSVAGANQVMMHAFATSASAEIEDEHAHHNWSQLINVTAGQIYIMALYQNSGASLNITSRYGMNPATITCVYLEDG